MLKMSGIKFFYVIFCKYELVGHSLLVFHLRNADLAYEIYTTTGSVSCVLKFEIWILKFELN
jgi:hypothetical protein